MKAKFFQIDTRMEIQLEDGTVFTSNEGETKPEFLDRTAQLVTDDLLETAEFIEVTPSSLAKKANKALVAAVETATGLELEMLNALLEKRGAKAAPATAEGETPEKAPKAAKVKKEKAPKVEKEKREKPSLDAILDAAKDAKVNIGKVVEFSPFRSAFKVVGEIKQVVVDTRVNRAYYRILLLEDGKLTHSEITNSSIVVDEEATEKLAAEREAEATKKAEEKAAAKAKKAEKTEKVEKAPKAKKEKVVKEKAEKVAPAKGPYIAPEVSGDDEEFAGEAE